MRYLPHVIDIADIDTELIGTLPTKVKSIVSPAYAGLNSLPGFIIAPTIFTEFAREKNLAQIIKLELSQSRPQDPHQLERTAQNIQRLIIRQPFSPDLVKVLRTPFQKHIKNNWFKITADPFQKDVKPDILLQPHKGESTFFSHLREIWAAYYSASTIYRSFQQPSTLFSVPIILIRQYKQATVSGKLYTIDPYAGDKRSSVIEARWGLPPQKVKAPLIPDVYHVDNVHQSISRKQTVDQPHQYLLDRFGHLQHKKTPHSRISAPKLSDSQIMKLFTMGKKAHNQLFSPQKITWIISDNEIYILKMMNLDIDTHIPADHHPHQPIPSQLTANLKCIAKGLPTSPGLVSGPVRLIMHSSDTNRLEAGEIAVAKQSHMDLLTVLKKAQAIVTDAGGPTSHAAIAAREVGCTAVLGTKNITQKVKTGDVITVNGQTGEIFLGGLPRKLVSVPFEAKLKQTRKQEVIHHTATKVLANLSDDEFALAASAKNADGVGMLRGELICAQYGIHPQKLKAKTSRQKYIEYLTKKLLNITQAFGTKPVFYKNTDFHTVELQQFPSGKQYEPEEENPFIGYRGAMRTLADPSFFEMELEAIAQVRYTFKQTNLHLAVSFVRTPEQLQQIKRILAASHLHRTPSFNLLLMIDTPAIALDLPAFHRVGLDGFILNTNHLTALTLGLDPNNTETHPLFDERNSAVKTIFTRAIQQAQQLNSPIFASGAALSKYHDLVVDLVTLGISGVSVDFNLIPQIRQLVYQAEQNKVK